MTTLAAQLAAVRDLLLEGRRWVRTNATECRRNLAEAAQRLDSVIYSDLTGNFPVGGPETPYAAFCAILERTRDNLLAGAKCILACPAATIGAIDLAAWELAVEVGRMEREPETE